LTPFILQCLHRLTLLPQEGHGNSSKSTVILPQELHETISKSTQNDEWAG
jgi:hypothetical protein